jgi:hypothetical protein
MWFFTCVYNAMSRAKAIKVRRKAKNDTTRDARIALLCVKKDKMNAKKMAAVAN